MTMDKRAAAAALSRQVELNIPGHPPVGPTITVSLDLDSEFIKEYGIDGATKVLDLMKNEILECCRRNWKYGILPYEELRRSLLGVRMVVRLRTLLIDGTTQDALIPNGSYPRVIDMTDISVV